MLLVVSHSTKKFFGAIFALIEHKCKETRHLRRDVQAGNWLELAGIGIVSVVNGMELAETGWNWLELVEPAGLTAGLHPPILRRVSKKTPKD